MQKHLQSVLIVKRSIFFSFMISSLCRFVGFWGNSVFVVRENERRVIQ